MTPTSYRRAFLLALVSVASLLAGCDDPKTRDIKSRLAGTWFSESPEHGGIARRELIFQAGGGLEERVTITAPSGASDTRTRAGEWFFDGVNLKRKYTYVDGQPLTNAHFIYETHEIRSVTATELVAASNVGRGELRLKRKPPGAGP